MTDHTAKDGRGRELFTVNPEIHADGAPWRKATADTYDLPPGSPWEVGRHRPPTRITETHTASDFAAQEAGDEQGSRDGR